MYKFSNDDTLIGERLICRNGYYTVDIIRRQEIFPDFRHYGKNVGWGRFYRKKGEKEKIFFFKQRKNKKFLNVANFETNFI